MHDRRVRVAFLGLILAFPLLMAATGTGMWASREAVLLIVGVEAVLIAGLKAAARERRQLLHDRNSVFVAGRPVTNAPRAARRLRTAPRMWSGGSTTWGRTRG